MHHSLPRVNCCKSPLPARQHPLHTHLLCGRPSRNSKEQGSENSKQSRKQGSKGSCTVSQAGAGRAATQGEDQTKSTRGQKQARTGRALASNKAAEHSRCSRAGGVKPQRWVLALRIILYVRRHRTVWPVQLTQHRKRFPGDAAPERGCRYRKEAHHQDDERANYALRSLRIDTILVASRSRSRH